MDPLKKINIMVADMSYEMEEFFSLRESDKESKKFSAMFREHPRWKDEPQLLKIIDDFANMKSMKDLIACKERLITAKFFIDMFEFRPAVERIKKDKSIEADVIRLFFEYISMFSEWLTKMPDTEKRYLDSCDSEEQREAVKAMLQIVKIGASKFGTFKAENVN